MPTHAQIACAAYSLFWPEQPPSLGQRSTRGAHRRTSNLKMGGDRRRYQPALPSVLRYPRAAFVPTRRILCEQLCYRASQMGWEALENNSKR